MIIYKDVITGDELFSDSYEPKLIDDMYYEVDGRLIDVGGGIDESLIGGNASAEGGEDEGAADSVAKVINIVHSHQLQEVPYDKKSYTAYIKDYMKSLKTYLSEKKPDRVDPFMKGIQPVVKKILGNFGDYQFFTGESMNPEGMVVLMNYRDDGITPFFIFFKDGVKEEKV
eukprot:comp9151_c0_seq1/m.4313 comp9151_c0_seq1/g.4313  ORF comp9151_c0_seq1/g.4313 comp9151_c0_seq1/m.4313 type:complete len:171 (-) comp9151_c0_seq1:258-770(-)